MRPVRNHPASLAGAPDESANSIPGRSRLSKLSATPSQSDAGQAMLAGRSRVGAAAFGRDKAHGRLANSIATPSNSRGSASSKLSKVVASGGAGEALPTPVESRSKYLGFLGEDSTSRLLMSPTLENSPSTSVFSSICPAGETPSQNGALLANSGSNGVRDLGQVAGPGPMPAQTSAFARPVTTPASIVVTHSETSQAAVSASGVGSSQLVQTDTSANSTAANAPQPTQHLEANPSFESQLESLSQAARRLEKIFDSVWGRSCPDLPQADHQIHGSTESSAHMAEQGTLPLADVELERVLSNSRSSTMRLDESGRIATVSAEEVPDLCASTTSPPNDVELDLTNYSYKADLIPVSGLPPASTAAGQTPSTEANVSLSGFSKSPEPSSIDFEGEAVMSMPLHQQQMLPTRVHPKAGGDQSTHSFNNTATLSAELVFTKSSSNKSSTSAENPVERAVQDSSSGAALGKRRNTNLTLPNIGAGTSSKMVRVTNLQSRNPTQAGGGERRDSPGLTQSRQQPPQQRQQTSQSQIKRNQLQLVKRSSFMRRGSGAQAAATSGGGVRNPGSAPSHASLPPGASSTAATVVSGVRNATRSMSPSLTGARPAPSNTRQNGLPGLITSSLPPVRKSVSIPAGASKSVLANGPSDSKPNQLEPIRPSVQAQPRVGVPAKAKAEASHSRSRQTSQSQAQSQLSQLPQPPQRGSQAKLPVVPPIDVALAQRLSDELDRKEEAERAAYEKYQKELQAKQQEWEARQQALQRQQEQIAQALIRQAMHAQQQQQLFQQQYEQLEHYQEHEQQRGWHQVDQQEPQGQYPQHYNYNEYAEYDTLASSVYPGARSFSPLLVQPSNQWQAQDGSMNSTTSAFIYDPRLYMTQTNTSPYFIPIGAGHQPFTDSVEPKPNARMDTSPSPLESNEERLAVPLPRVPSIYGHQTSAQFDETGSHSSNNAVPQQPQIHQPYAPPGSRGSTTIAPDPVRLPPTDSIATFATNQESRRSFVSNPDQTASHDADYKWQQVRPMAPNPLVQALRDELSVQPLTATTATTREASVHKERTVGGAAMIPESGDEDEPQHEFLVHPDLRAGASPRSELAGNYYSDAAERAASWTNPHTPQILEPQTSTASDLPSRPHHAPNTWFRNRPSSHHPLSHYTSSMSMSQLPQQEADAESGGSGESGDSGDSGDSDPSVPHPPSQDQQQFTPAHDADNPAVPTAHSGPAPGATGAQAVSGAANNFGRAFSRPASGGQRQSNDVDDGDIPPPPRGSVGSSSQHLNQQASLALLHRHRSFMLGQSHSASPSGSSLALGLAPSHSARHGTPEATGPAANGRAISRRPSSRPMPRDEEDISTDANTNPLNGARPSHAPVNANGPSTLTAHNTHRVPNPTSTAWNVDALQQHLSQMQVQIDHMTSLTLSHAGGQHAPHGLLTGSAYTPCMTTSTTSLIGNSGRAPSSRELHHGGCPGSGGSRMPSESELEAEAQESSRMNSNAPSSVHSVAVSNANMVARMPPTMNMPPSQLPGAVARDMSAQVVPARASLIMPGSSAAARPPLHPSPPTFDQDEEEFIRFAQSLPLPLSSQRSFQGSTVMPRPEPIQPYPTESLCYRAGSLWPDAVITNQSPKLSFIEPERSHSTQRGTRGRRHPRCQRILPRWHRIYSRFTQSVRSNLTTTGECNQQGRLSAATGILVHSSATPTLRAAEPPRSSVAWTNQPRRPFAASTSSSSTSVSDKQGLGQIPDREEEISHESKLEIQRRAARRGVWLPVAIALASGPLADGLSFIIKSLTDRSMPISALLVSYLSGVALSKIVGCKPGIQPKGTPYANSYQAYDDFYASLRNVTQIALGLGAGLVGWGLSPSSALTLAPSTSATVALSSLFIWGMTQGAGKLLNVPSDSTKLAALTSTACAQAAFGASRYYFWEHRSHLETVWTTRVYGILGALLYPILAHEVCTNVIGVSPAMMAQTLGVFLGMTIRHPVHIIAAAASASALYASPEILQVAMLTNLFRILILPFAMAAIGRTTPLMHICLEETHKYYKLLSPVQTPLEATVRGFKIACAQRTPLMLFGAALLARFLLEGLATSQAVPFFTQGDLSSLLSVSDWATVVLAPAMAAAGLGTMSDLPKTYKLHLMGAVTAVSAVVAAFMCIAAQKEMHQSSSKLSGDELGNKGGAAQ